MCPGLKTCVQNTTDKAGNVIRKVKINFWANSGQYDSIRLERFILRKLDQFDLF